MYKCISAFIAALFLLITLYVSSLPIVFSSEKSLLLYYEKGKELIFPHKNNGAIEDSVLLVNTHYANKLVMERVVGEDGLYDVGEVPVLNRQLLYDFLISIKNANYKYILLDIFLDKADNQPGDEKLFQLIASMKHIGIAALYSEKTIADSMLIAKSGSVDYRTSFWETGFVKYRFKPDGKRSIALKMYEEITSDTTSIDGFLARHNAILSFDYRGSDVEQLQDFPAFADDVKDKYIIIGDFGDIDGYFGDTHVTYAGKVPGPIVNFNAYLFLKNGHHHISPLLIIILFLTFWWLAYQTLKQSSLTWLFMWIGYPTFLTFLFFLIYICYNEIYDVLFTALLFYLLKTVVTCIRERKLIYTRCGEIKNNLCRI